MQHFTFTQIIPVNIQRAWEFFSTPYNLGKITPPAMNFRILNLLPEQVYEGMFIIYRVSPIAGIPMEWVTEITHVRVPHFFIDEQRKGPYAIWHHEHHFEEVTGGTKMTDKLYYSLPLGPIGKMANRLIIKNKVLSIFEYRKKVLADLFR